MTLKQAQTVKRALRTYRNRVREAVAPRRQPTPRIVETGNPKANALSTAVHAAFEAAVEKRHPIDRRLLELEGMSGRKYRAFINKLIALLDHATYLEVGVWAGSTLCAAIHGNAVTALAIDDWSQFGGPAAQFFRNVSRFRGPGNRVSFLERDFRGVDYGAIGKYQVFLFDGPHREEDQHDGVVLAQPALEHDHVLIVDDWNWEPVRRGTERAIAELKLRVNYAIDLRTTLDNTHAVPGREKSDWHNGYFLAAVSKA